MAVYRVTIDDKFVGTIYEENAILAIRQTMILQNMKYAIVASAVSEKDKNDYVDLTQPWFHAIDGFCWNQSHRPG